MNPAPMLRPDADETVAGAQSWLYRSEAFAEDLGEGLAADDASDSASLPARLAWPLSALVIGLGLMVGFGL